MKATADQAHTVIIGEARSPVGVSLGLRLIGDEEVATITLTQHDRTVTLYVTDQAHAAQIAAAIQGQQPLAAEAPRVEAKATAMTDYQLVPFPPTPEMVSAAEDAYMPFGDMELALRMAILAAPAPVERNQCDGCQAGIPVENGRHRMGKPGRYPDLMLCTADRYSTPQPAAPDVAGLVHQHHRDSGELRRLCQARDEQRDGRLAALERAAKAESDVAALMEALERSVAGFDALSGMASLDAGARNYARQKALELNANLAAHRKGGDAP